jgi:hypothetical protein
MQVDAMWFRNYKSTVLEQTETTEIARRDVNSRGAAATAESQTRTPETSTTAETTATARNQGTLVAAIYNLLNSRTVAAAEVGISRTSFTTEGTPAMVARNSTHSKEQQTYLDIHGQATARMCGHLS